MSSVLAVFEEVGTNRRVLVNFGQMTQAKAGGAATAIHYSDGSTQVIRATFDEVCAVVGVAGEVAPKAGV